jgi:hypothetical protein
VLIVVPARQLSTPVLVADDDGPTVDTLANSGLVHDAELTNHTAAAAHHGLPNRPQSTCASPIL